MPPLPVIDRALLRVRALCDDHDSSTKDLVAALEADPNLAANVLRHANSAWSARPVRASSVHQAVTLIGRRAIGALVMEAVICSYFEQARGAGGVAHGQLHIHAVHVGSLAAELGRRTGQDDGEAHLAGLLHDLGKLVLPQAFGAEVVDAVARSAPAGPDRVAAERAELGVDHAYAGARFLEASRLPASLVGAVAAHHGGEQSPSAVAHCVQLANAAVAVLAGQPFDGELLEVGLAALGLDTSLLEDAATSAVPALVPQEGPDAPTLAAQVARLEHEAKTDELTGLLNRRYWSLEAKAVLERRPGTVLLVDVDHFKRVNDRYGHHIGDFVLTEIAAALRARGTAGRLGGDEFAVVLEDLDARGTAAAAIIADIDRRFAADELAVSVSIGVATTAAGVELGAALRVADDAVYDAKGAGRGTFRVAHCDGRSAPALPARAA